MIASSTSTANTRALLSWMVVTKRARHRQSTIGVGLLDMDKSILDSNHSLRQYPISSQTKPWHAFWSRRIATLYSTHKLLPCPPDQSSHLIGCINRGESPFQFCVSFRRFWANKLHSASSIFSLCQACTDIMEHRALQAQGCLRTGNSSTEIAAKVSFQSGLFSFRGIASFCVCVLKLLHVFVSL